VDQSVVNGSLDLVRRIYLRARGKLSDCQDPAISFGGDPR
jgi:hypothetical protein